MISRQAYILTGNFDSERAIFSKNILEQIGFTVILIKYIEHDDKVLSNKISMQYIYNLIQNTNEEYCYVFEDDINMIESIDINEIIKYEKYSTHFFYLGMCEYNANSKNTIKTDIIINNHIVYCKTGNVRGLHAIGLSKNGAKELLEFSNNSIERYMDVILEQFSLLYPANVVRYDFESYIYGHKGILYQDRKKFPTTI